MCKPEDRPAIVTHIDHVGETILVLSYSQWLRQQRKERVFNAVGCVILFSLCGFLWMPPPTVNWIAIACICVYCWVAPFYHSYQECMRYMNDLHRIRM